MSALQRLIERGEQYPNASGTLGFVTDLGEFIPVLEELTPRVPLSVLTVGDDGDAISFEVRIGFTLARSEMDEEEQP